MVQRGSSGEVPGAPSNPWFRASENACPPMSPRPAPFKDATKWHTQCHAHAHRLLRGLNGGSEMRVAGSPSMPGSAHKQKGGQQGGEVGPSAKVVGCGVGCGVGWCVVGRCVQRSGSGRDVCRLAEAGVSRARLWEG